MGGWQDGGLGGGLGNGKVGERGEFLWEDESVPLKVQCQGAPQARSIIIITTFILSNSSKHIKLFSNE